MQEFIILIPTLITTLSTCGVLIICLCELNNKHVKNHKLRRTQYVILMTGAMLAGFQPLLWATIPSMGTALMSTSVLIFLLIHTLKKDKTYE